MSDARICDNPACSQTIVLPSGSRYELSRPDHQAAFGVKDDHWDVCSQPCLRALADRFSPSRGEPPPKLDPRPIPVPSQEDFDEAVLELKRSRVLLGGLSAFSPEQAKDKERLRMALDNLIDVIEHW